MDKWAFHLSNFKAEFNGRGRARNHIEVMPDSPSGVFPLTSAPDLKLGPFFWREDAPRALAATGLADIGAILRNSSFRLP
jgi:hypothetical protein